MVSFGSRLHSGSIPWPPSMSDRTAANPASHFAHAGEAKRHGSTQHAAALHQHGATQQAQAPRTPPESQNKVTALTAAFPFPRVPFPNCGRIICWISWRPPTPRAWLLPHHWSWYPMRGPCVTLPKSTKPTKPRQGQLFLSCLAVT